MTRIQSARSARLRRPIELWLTLAPAALLAEAIADGAIVTEAPAAAGDDPFELLAAARAAGATDVRRLGVLCATPRHVDVARRSGAGAVLAVAADAAQRALLAAAEPDALATPDQAPELERRRWGSAARPHVLLNPGPGLTTEGVKRSAVGADVCHREIEYVELERRVRRKLLALVGAPEGWELALLSGSGTAANEAAVRASVRPGQRLAVVVNGVYGERLAETARRAGFETVRIEESWRRPVSPEQVAASLAAGGIDAVAVVHHETTTGLLNPVEAIAAVAHAAGALVVVDAISSLGAEQLDVVGTPLDFVTCSSNKCLHGLPGAAFVLVSPAGGRRARRAEPSSVYLDLPLYLEAGTAHAPPYTPALPALNTLDQALDELLAEGPVARRAAYAARAAQLDALLDRVGLVQLVEPGHRSRSVRTVRLPDGLSFAAIHDHLRARGFVVYAGQGPLAAGVFRVACMGAMRDDDLDAFDAALTELLAA